jgi:hypothetical protein
MSHRFTHPELGSIDHAAPPKCGNHWIEHLLLALGFTAENNGLHRPSTFDADWKITIRREPGSWLQSFYVNHRNLGPIGSPEVEALQKRDWSSFLAFATGCDLEPMWASYQYPGTITLHTETLAADFAAFFALVIQRYPRRGVTPPAKFAAAGLSSFSSAPSPVTADVGAS